MPNTEAGLDREAIREITLAHLDELRIPRPGRPPIPSRVLVAAALPLGAAAAVGLAWPRLATAYAGLAWLPALVPIFLLSHYRGWRGSAVAGATAVAVFAVVHVVGLGWVDLPVRWGLFGLVAGMLGGASVGAGWVAEALFREGRRSLRTALQAALKDPVSGLPTRRALDLFLANRVAAAARGAQLTIVLFDLDNLRTLNARLGRSAGDQLLARVGEVFRETARAMDLVGRFAGEEFLAVLTGEDASGATVFAERVRKKAADLKVTGVDGSLVASGVTLSAAVVPFGSAMEGTGDLLEAAFAAVKAAKDEGGDRVAVHRPGKEEPRVVVKGRREPEPGSDVGG